MLIDRYPTVCNLCGGAVEFISNDLIYGTKYGSGYCYHCNKCNAYVGTHKVRPMEAMGILADTEMRAWKMQCHDLFDLLWRTNTERTQAYSWLANELDISVDECHFGYFDLVMLKRAYSILCKYIDENGVRL